MATNKQDSRTRAVSAPNVRGTRAATADNSRTNMDGNSSLTVEQRRQRIRSEFVQEALPAAPVIPGYHTCWLSSTSTYDPIHKRMRLGYTPVSIDEVPGMAKSAGATSGEYAGCVVANEMVLFKVPEDQYQLIMSELHYHQPLEEELAIRNRMEEAARTDSNGKDLSVIEGDGFESLGRGGSQAPTFA